MLTIEQKTEILCGNPLKDYHIECFVAIVRECSHYNMKLLNSDDITKYIEPANSDVDEIHILYILNHWVCLYYDTINFYLYDSTNQQKLFSLVQPILKKIYPNLDITQEAVKFPVVQKQQTDNDSGIHAIANATSLVFSIKPDKMKYEYDLMRLHLLQMIEDNSIQSFPQDKYYNPTNVLPLAVALCKNKERIRLQKYMKKKNK